MAQDAKKRQQRLARKTAKRKTKQTKIRRPAVHKTPSPKKAGSWRLYECLISADWRKPGEIVQIAVVRESEEGYMAVGAFLVDLGCLGVKNALANIYPSKSDYKREYRSSLTGSQKIKNCDLNLAAKVVREATEYAHSLGLKPHRDIRRALQIMGEADPDACEETVPLGGEDGKPLFIAGPYDNVDRILKTLDRNVGPGEYNYIVPMGGPFFD
jgi:hypothetical protein